MKKSPAGRIVFIIACVFLFAVFALFAYSVFCTMRGKIAYLGNCSYIRIVSNSMSPTIEQGDYIMIEKVFPADIAVGDIIVFTSKDPTIYGKKNTHRVKEIKTTDNGLSFVTKGDNNLAVDEFEVDEGDVLGRYVKNLPALSKLYSFFATPAAFACLIIIPSVVLLFFSVRDVVKKAKETKKDSLVDKEVDRLKKEGISKDDLEKAIGSMSEEEKERLHIGNLSSEEKTVEKPCGQDVNPNGKEE